MMVKDLRFSRRWDSGGLGVEGEQYEVPDQTFVPYELGILFFFGKGGTSDEFNSFILYFCTFQCH